MKRLLGALVEFAFVGLLFGPAGMAVWAGLYLIYGLAKLAAAAIIANQENQNDT